MKNSITISMKKDQVIIRVDENAVPTPFKGNAIALITTALMALAFLAFSGIM